MSRHLSAAHRNADEAELAVGIEPTTCCLQGSCSTTELRQQLVGAYCLIRGLFGSFDAIPTPGPRDKEGHGRSPSGLSDGRRAVALSADVSQSVRCIEPGDLPVDVCT